jgi:hypothetical protein
MPKDRSGKTKTRSGASLSLLIKELVKNRIDLWNVSHHLNVNPSTIIKLLEGRPISRVTVKKIKSAFLGLGMLHENSVTFRYPEWNQTAVERFRVVYQLYVQENSLRVVGRRLGLSRERIRQLLERGSEMGLFKYTPLKSPRSCAANKIIGKMNDSPGSFL